MHPLVRTSTLTANVSSYLDEPGQDNECVSLDYRVQQVHILAEMLEQAPDFSYGVPDLLTTTHVER